MGNNIAIDRKIPWLTKIAYGSTAISSMLSSMLVTTYVFYFYNEILLIPAAAAATISLIGRIWSWFVDPTVAVFIETSKSGKHGKTRRLLLLFAIPGGLAMFLTFAVPEVSAPVQIAWVAVTYILQATLSSLLTMARSTLMSRITTNRTERTNMQQIYSILGTVISLTMTSETLTLVTALGGGDMRRGFTLTALIFGALFAFFYLLFFVTTKGYEPTEDPQLSTPVEKKKGSSFKDILAAAATNKYWLFAMLIQVFYMMQAQTMVSYFTHCMGNAQTPLRIYSLASLVVTTAGYLTLGFFTKHFGNAGTRAIGCTIAAVGNLFRFIMRDSTFVLYGVGLTIGSFGASLMSGVLMLVILDTGVYSEWKTGKNSDPVLLAGMTVSSKFALAVGGAAAGYLLAAFGYDSAAGAPSETVKNLFYMNTLLVGIGFALAAVCSFINSRYEKRIPQMRAEIEARKAEKAYPGKSPANTR